MPNPHTAANRRAARRLAPAALLAALALTGCTTQPIAGIPVPQPPHPTTTTPATITPNTTSARATTSTREPGEGRAQALEVAKRWLAAYRTDRWTDSPTAWIDRVRPLVTDSMHTRNRELRDAGVSHDWRTFVAQRCTSTTTDLDAVIPPEAPTDTHTLHVQIAATIRTTCPAATPPNTHEPAAATITLVLTTDGWRVDQRLY